MHRVDAATETRTTPKVHRAFSQALQQARLAKKLSQKQLAQMVNEKPQVVMQYESGGVVPRPPVVQKLNRALGGTLPSATGNKKSTKGRK
jgi:putative transcription factor